MSQETFPKHPDPPRSETAPNPMRVVQARDTDDSEQVVQWLREAMAQGYDFVYHQVTPPETDRRMMLIAKGFDSSRIIRVLLDEEKLPANP